MDNTQCQFLIIFVLNVVCSGQIERDRSLLFTSFAELVELTIEVERGRGGFLAARFLNLQVSGILPIARWQIRIFIIAFIMCSKLLLLNQRAPLHIVAIVLGEFSWARTVGLHCAST